MSEVEKFKCIGYMVGRSRLGGAEYVFLSDFDRVTAERDAALGREAELREELEIARDDLVIFKSAVSALGEASKKLVFCARTSGGTAGPDYELMDACAGVEGVITLGGIARAMNEFERLTAERDDLSARLEQARDRKNSIVDMQQRLTAADERAAVLEGLLRRSMLAMSRIYEAGRDFIVGSGSDCDSVELMMENDPMAREIRAALKPAEGRGDE